MRVQRRSRKNRQAFTLVEVMLTLCLLVMLAALVYPSLRKPIAGQRLKKAADAVRAQWISARADAMDTGRTHIFCYEPNADGYRVEAEVDVLDNSTGEFGMSQMSTDAADLGIGQPAEEPAAKRQTLPEGVTFVGAETADDTRASTVMLQANSRLGTEAMTATPILFYPDGTTSTARLVLKNEYGRSIELRLRGLTGTVDVGQPTGELGQPAAVEESVQ